MKKENLYIKSGRNTKRCISLLMVVVLLFFMLPLEKATFKAAEPEEEGISYREYDEENKIWNMKKCNNYQTLTDSDSILNEGWYVVNGEVTCSNLLTVQGEVHLILTDECVLQATKGIRVADGNSLTIYAQAEGENMGKLTAKGFKTEAAGIGGYNSGESNGSITIHSGNITAEGGLYGAGIGGARNGNGKDIVINGGIITSIGGENEHYQGEGAGIGGGGLGEGTNITINGGTITATGTNDGAGIGGGDKSAGHDITINGGTVIATAGSFGAGIGGGDRGAGYDITINGGNVTAKSSLCAGIGGGYEAEGTKITINNGIVSAKGSTGIGGSGIADRGHDGSEIHIKDAIVEAIGGSGAGIGGCGYTGNGEHISITNSRVTATGCTYNSAAGIGGGGYAASGTDISITNSYVIANGYALAAGIGGGREGSGENISIENSIVRTTSTSEKAFIGGGDEGESINITKENSIIFEGSTGTVYGNATLAERLLGESVELEIGFNETLTAPKGTSLLLSGKLTNNGTFTIYNESCLSGEGILGGDGEFILEYASFTADDIIVPEGMVYNGEDQTDYADKNISVDISKYNPKIICNTEFTIQNALSDEWEKSIVPAEVKKAGDYLAVYTNTEDNTSWSKEFKVAKSAMTYNDSENKTTLKSYEENEEKNQFIYGSNITIKVTPRLVDTAAQTISDELRANTYQEPLAGEIAVFTQKDGEEVQLTEAETVVGGSEVLFDINTLQQSLTPGTYTLSVRYKGTEDTADYSEDITVTVAYHEAADSAALLDTNKGENGWYTGAVTVKAPQGYQIASQNPENAVWQESIEAKDFSLDENGDYIYYLKEKSTGYLTDKMILAAAKIDDTKPEFGDFIYTEGKSGTGIFVKIWNWLVGKDYITVTVPITEAGSGLTEDSIQIHLTNPEEADTDSTVTAKEIKLIGDTEDGYTLSFVIPAEFDGYFSVTAKDTAGNESSLYKQRTVTDTAKPEINIKLTGILYDETENVFENSAVIEISVDDSLNGEISAGLKTVTYSFDGEALVSLAPEGGFDGTAEGFVPILKAGEQIETNENGIHTLSVYAEDQAGNKTEKEITFQIYYSTTLSLSEKEGESGIYEIVYDGEPIEEDTDFLVTRKGCEKEIIYSYQCLDSEDNSYKDGLPTESGRYRIKAEIPQDDENFYFGAEATLELTIKKVQVEGNSHTIQVVKQKKHTISYDLSDLLPEEVRGTTIYSITDIKNEDGLLSIDTMPSVGLLNTNNLSFETEAAETAGKRAELTISFENANYEILDAVLIIESTDKIPVKISGVGILGMEESQLSYSRNAVSYSGTPKAEKEDGEIVNLTDSDYQYFWYQLIEDKYVEIPDNNPPVNIGSYKLLVNVENNEYMGTQEIPFEIVKRDISDAAITLGEGLIFNGAIQTQTLTEVKSGTLLLTEDEYMVTKNTGCEAGPYTLTITGTGNFTGTVEKEFTIAPLPVKLSWNVQTFIYDGEIHSVSAAVSNAVDGYEVSVSDYKSESAINAGTYTAQAAALDNPNYTLEDGVNLLTEYTIEKLDITERSDIEILLGDTLTYNGELQTQEISSVKIGNLNVTCQIFDNSAVNAGTYTLKITGDGNFTGIAEAEFTILQAENAPHMPDKTMNAAIKDGRRVNELSLSEYTDWIWSTEDADKILPTKENESIIVIAYYQGVDKENYKNISQQILITMIKCEHPEEQTVFITDYEPTCTKAGTGHRYCKVCDMVIEENIEIDAMGHSYGKPEFIWAEDFSSAEAVFTCERQGCIEEEAGHKKLLEAEVTVHVNENIIFYTAEVLYDGNLYLDEKQVISKKEETRLQISEGIAEIPESLKAAGYDTEEKIVEACVKMVLGAGYRETDKVMYDIVLQISYDGGKTWEIATENNFPREGITITIPYPKGTNAAEYDFIVTHMFSHTMNGFLAGEIEMPEVTKTEEGLLFVVKGLSPIMIAWKSLSSSEETIVSNTVNKTDQKEESPETGDRREENIWLLLIILSTAELTGVSYSKRKGKNR